MGVGRARGQGGVGRPRRSLQRSRGRRVAAQRRADGLAGLGHGTGGRRPGRDHRRSGPRGPRGHRAVDGGYPDQERRGYSQDPREDRRDVDRAAIQGDNSQSRKGHGAHRESTLRSGSAARNLATAYNSLSSGGLSRSVNDRRNLTMKTYLALLVAAVFSLSPLAGVAGENKVTDVKELAGSWRGWVTGEQGDERANMTIAADGKYKASTITGSTTEGEFFLQDGKLRYRSSRTTGNASLSEDKGKYTLKVSPEDPNYRTGRAEYERVKQRSPPRISGGRHGGGRSRGDSGAPRADDDHDRRLARGDRSRAADVVVSQLCPGEGRLDLADERHRSREDPYGSGPRGALRVPAHRITDGTAHRGMARRAGTFRRLARRADRRGVQPGDGARPVDVPRRREARADA